MEKTKKIKKVNVCIYGEKGWFWVTYTTATLDAMTFPSTELGLLTSSMGEMLDVKSSDELTEQEKDKLEMSLAKFLLQSGYYDKMKQSGYSTIFITSFRAKLNNKAGYLTQIAGYYSGDVLSLVTKADFTTEIIDHLLIECLRCSLKSYLRTYDLDSVFHHFTKLIGKENTKPERNP